MSDTEDVFSADKRRRQAILAGDRIQLEALLTDDYRYVHASGKVENRQEYLNTITPGKFLSLETEEPELRSFGDVCVMLGAINLRRMADGQIVEKRHQFTGVWINDGGRWKLSVFQNSSKSAG
jgi:ketosteroid isomerase-like protein